MTPVLPTAAGARPAVDTGNVEAIVREIERWSVCKPTPAAPPFLLSAPTYSALCSFHGGNAERFAAVSRCHRDAVQRHLAPVLLSALNGEVVDGPQWRMLTETMRADPLRAAFGLPDGNVSLEEVTRSHLETARRVWEPFSDWWRNYFSSGPEVPATELWQLYLPFADWIVREKRRRRPSELFMVGFNGSPGAGKTVLSTALSILLDELLDPDVEGRAVARSGDDWYLSRAEREQLRAAGYDPGLPGVSNRSLPGTHDLDWLLRNITEMERAGPGAVIRMGNFDKGVDDQPAGVDRYFEVRGKVGVFLFDLWFAGAETDIDPLDLPEGLQRRVAENLRLWAPVFDRMDALWAYDWPDYERMVDERLTQERLIAQNRRVQGMSPDHIRAFMSYMVGHAWDWQVTSPIPPEPSVTFRAYRDTDHRVIQIQRGGRAL